MKVWILAVGLSIGLQAAHVQGADTAMTAPEKVGFSGERLQRLDAVMQQAVADQHFGGIVTLVARHGKIVHFQSFGKPNLAAEASGKDTVFRMFSMTKPVTGAAMMLLYEEGKWSPKDPLSKYIPEFSNLKVYKGLSNFGALLLEEPDHPPTVRELMTHTAGFSYGAGVSPVDRLYGGEENKNIMESASLQAMIERLAKAPLLYQPSSRWVYSLSMDIQGYIIEKLSGMTLPEFMRKRLFEPLGMRDTGFYVPQEKANRLATVYTTSKGQVVPTDKTLLGMKYDREPAIPLGGAGLVSTAVDYFHFAQMLLNEGELNGVRVLAPSSVKLMTSNHLPERMTAEYKNVVTNCPRLGMGYGYDGAVVIDPGKADVPMGKGTYIWDGAMGTWFWVDPVYDVVFVGMVQRVAGDGSGGPAPDLQELSRATTYQALVKPEL